MQLINLYMEGFRKMPEKKTVFIKTAGFLLCVFCLLCLATVVLKPKRMENPYDNTRKGRGFYAEPKNSLDLIFVGSSQLFSTMAPAVLWEEQGITSYVYGGNEQTFSISYYYIMEALKYQKPRAIVLEVTFCNWGEMPRDAVVRLNFDDMRWGKAKILGILNNVEPENWEYFFFELAKYHSRWDMLSTQDFAFKEIYESKNPYKGWSAYGKHPLGDESVDPEIINCAERKELNETALFWLEKIICLCQKENVELILLKTPDNGLIIEPPEEGSEEIFQYIDGMPYYNSLADLAKERGIAFLNMNYLMPGEDHNSIAKARKATSCFGKWVQERLHIEDKRGEAAYAYWNDAKGDFDEE